MDCRIYYGDGAVFEGKPELAPPHNVQCIAWDDPIKGTEATGRVVIHQWDIYIYSAHVGGWHGTNKYADLLQHLGQGCGLAGVRAVLQGAWIDRITYDAIYKRACNDEGLTRKNAVNPIIEDGLE